jgi:hypothetical protein
MNKIHVFLIFIATFACSCASTEITTTYIDNLQVCCIDTTFDSKLKRNVVFGINQNDTIYLSSTSSLTQVKQLNTHTANGFQILHYLISKK